MREPRLTSAHTRKALFVPAHTSALAFLRSEVGVVASILFPLDHLPNPRERTGAAPTGAIGRMRKPPLLLLERRRRPILAVHEHLKLVFGELRGNRAARRHVEAAAHLLDVLLCRVVDEVDPELRRERRVVLALLNLATHVRDERRHLAPIEISFVVEVEAKLVGRMLVEATRYGRTSRTELVWGQPPRSRLELSDSTRRRLARGVAPDDLAALSFDDEHDQSFPISEGLLDPELKTSESFDCAQVSHGSLRMIWQRVAVASGRERRATFSESVTARTFGLSWWARA